MPAEGSRFAEIGESLIPKSIPRDDIDWVVTKSYWRALDAMAGFFAREVWGHTKSWCYNCPALNFKGNSHDELGIGMVEFRELGVEIACLEGFHSENGSVNETIGRFMCVEGVCDSDRDCQTRGPCQVPHNPAKRPLPRLRLLRSPCDPTPTSSLICRWARRRRSVWHHVDAWLGTCGGRCALVPAMRPRLQPHTPSLHCSPPQASPRTRRIRRATSRSGMIRAFSQRAVQASC